MSSHYSIELADRLNADCHCVSLDRAGLEAELERVSPGFHAEVMAGRSHLFSGSAVFVGAEHVQRMARLVAAVERVVALPAYAAHVLAWAPESARHRSAAPGVFLGFGKIQMRARHFDLGQPRKKPSRVRHIFRRRREHSRRHVEPRVDQRPGYKLTRGDPHEQSQHNKCRQ